MPEISFPIGLPPTETLEFFQAKGSYRLIDRWWEMWEEEHVRAFTVTGITNTSLLESVRASLDQVLDGGGTFEMWKTSILPDLKTAVAAGTAPINILTDRRLRTIYETNIRMARAAGKWKRIQVTKARRPYLMYVALDDGRTRPLHALWGGLTTGKPIIAPVDHIIWTILFPPNGWGCRCSVIQLSERSLVERNLQLTTDAELIEMKLIKADGSLDGDPFDYVRGDGAIISVPRGIDPGFAYNVGEAHLRGLADSLYRSLDELAANNVPVAQAVLTDVLAQTGIEALLIAKGSDFPVMVLGNAERALIGADTSVVRLSAATYAKQLREHPELGIANYRKLIEIGATPQIILRQGEFRIILIKADGGKWLKATVKVTQNRGELFVVNYQFADAREVKRLRRLNEIIRDEG